MSKKNDFIPKAVKEAARGFTRFGGELRKIGSKNGYDFYTCFFPEGNTYILGIPQVYLWDGEHVKKIAAETQDLSTILEYAGLN